MDAQKLSLAITKALAYTENGGEPSTSSEKAGKSGELKSIFQFLPATWKADAKEVTGNENLPLTPANEALVAHGIVSKQVDTGLAAGKTPDTIAKEVASSWNAGNPNAYKENVKGVNKEGVSYDTPAYADKVSSYTKQFLSDIDDGQQIADTNGANTDSGNATAVVNKFLTSIQGTQTAPQAQKPSLALAANAPLPQNNVGLNSGMLPLRQPQVTPGLLS